MPHLERNDLNMTYHERCVRNSNNHCSTTFTCLY
ncbi:hypothetical protein T03_16230 [Trichinella britovi]|uniref:Uncharacterized protein n=1 Tax=Trichinella britovi TaxID=45882 RepID=A0A0V1AHL4_TRIBR|nr:hypothetical protein T03_16230 [Trichinella britovi]